MHEIELKFQVPPDAREAVRRAVATASARRMRLQARYFDTPDGRLAAAGLALRMRKEGRRWVQTLKSRGDGFMQRGEHEVPLSAGRDAPPLDIARHAGTAAGLALAQALEGCPDAPAERFATDIQRTWRRVRVAGGVVVELAFDEGEIRAGAARLPVCELEFELIGGPASALPALAGRWVQRHGLWLDPRSKAERGERLARGADVVPEVKAGVPPLAPSMDGPAALRAMVASALDQVLANACELAGGQGTSEHLHQCRVGLRRLRCALRDFASLAGTDTPPASQAWQEQIRTVFARLGVARDRDALRESLLPRLAQAGAPLFELPPDEAEPEDPGAVLRERGCNALWLEILTYQHAAPRQRQGAGAGEAEAPLSGQVRAILRRLRRRVARNAAGFEGLDDSSQHLTRKRLKRLRYGVEFCSSLYPDKAVARYLALLRPAQDALGEANDLVVARTLFEQHVTRDPRAWFVLGWLAGRRPAVQAQCARALARIARRKGFWRGAPDT